MGKRVEARPLFPSGGNLDSVLGPYRTMGVVTPDRRLPPPLVIDDEPPKLPHDEGGVLGADPTMPVGPMFFAISKEPAARVDPSRAVWCAFVLVFALLSLVPAIAGVLALALD